MISRQLSLRVLMSAIAIISVAMAIWLPNILRNAAFARLEKSGFIFLDRGGTVVHRPDGAVTIDAMHASNVGAEEIKLMAGLGSIQSIRIANWEGEEWPIADWERSVPLALRDREVTPLFQMQGVVCLDFTGLSLSFDGLASSPCASSLKELRIGMSNVDDRRLRDILSKTNLRVLDIKDTAVSDVTIRTLARQTSLEELDVTHTKIGTLAAKSIAELPRLRRLVVAYTDISDDECELLSQCKSLEDVNLSHTKVSWRGVRKLGKLPKLQCLSLRGTDIRIQRLGCENEFRSLIILDLNDTSVADSDFEDACEMPCLESIYGLPGDVLYRIEQDKRRFPKL